MALVKTNPQDNQRLEETLLAIGGKDVISPGLWREYDYEKLFKWGRQYETKIAIVSQARQNPNVWETIANCYCFNRVTNKFKGSTIAVGYALGYDGTWEEYCWIVQRYHNDTRNSVILLLEGKEKHKAYFGYELSEAECVQFCRNLGYRV